MRKATCAIAMVVVLGVAACASAQAPDLTGRWALQPDPATTNTGGFCGNLCAIRQAQTRLIVQLSGRTVEYALDGSESRTTTRNGGTAIEIITTATWSGSHLVIQRTARELNGERRTARVTTEVYLSGGNMIVEVRGSGPGQPTPAVSRATYKKAG